MKKFIVERSGLGVEIKITAFDDEQSAIDFIDMLGTEKNGAMYMKDENNEAWQLSLWEDYHYDSKYEIMIMDNGIEYHLTMPILEDEEVARIIVKRINKQNGTDGNGHKKYYFYKEV